VWTSLEQTDEDPLYSSNVILLYTGRSQEKEYRDQGTSVDYSQYDGGDGIYNDSWNREHVWPKSHGFPDETDTAYTDIHHLRPADRTVNSSRGTKDFSWGDTWHDEATECKVSDTAWEPRDAVKGDVARMIFYMSVRYENTGEYNLEMVDFIPTDEYTPSLGKKSTLLQWHQSDPVDDFERNRNDVIYTIQGNRNPFIDHPEYADAIWGSTPNAPSDITVSNETDSAVTLTWTDQSDNEDGFYVYVDGSLNKTLGENITTANITSLLPGNSYTFGVSAYNTAGESATASVTGSTTGGTAGPLYISEVADASGTGNYIYEYLEIHNFGTVVVDAGGYILRQIESTQSYTIPSETHINGKGFLILGRNANQSAFESFWGVTLGSDVTYLNSGNAFPLINGDEQYLLEDGTGGALDPADGTYTALAVGAGTRIYRLNTSNTLVDWGNSNDTEATPGTLDADQSLPVTLISFTAKAVKGKVILEWETSAEIENQGFLLSREERGTRNERDGFQIRPVDSVETVGIGHARSLIASFVTDDALKGQVSTTETTQYRYVDTSVEPGKTYVYTLADVDYANKENILKTIEVTAEDENAIVTDGYALDPVYPNPFNATLTIPFTLTERMNVSIDLYSITGQKMMTVVNRKFGAGSYNYIVQTHDLASGIYFVCLVFNGRNHIQKAVLLK